MKAVVFRTSSGLVLEDVLTPKPAPDQVLVQVANAGFCGTDHTIVENRIMPDGYILGHEISGTVVEMGPKTKGATVGDRVTIRPTECGQCPECVTGSPALCKVDRRTIGVGDLPGGFAEYLVAYPQMLIPIPDGTDSKNAAMAEMFATSLHAIQSSGVQSGSALVMGGGPIGLALVRLLKIKNFDPVVLSEPVAKKRKLGKTYGAKVTIDPFKDELQSFVQEITQGKGFGIVFECAGVPANIQAGINSAAVKGLVSVVSVIPAEAKIIPMTLNVQREVRLVGSWANSQEENLQCLRWMAEGKLDGTALISDLITLEELPLVYKERIHSGKITKVIINIGEAF